ncbi:MAG: RNase H family protein, partial [Pseudomonadota bacterium]|nr:RNase H family protein [Pseudomonadota bacterium]
MKYEIFTDGACSGNPGPGGWGVLIDGPDGARDLSGGAPSTTNNQMELMA